MLDGVQTIGVNGGVTATEVRKYIAAHGFRATGKNFDVGTVLALTRLADQGKITTELAHDQVFGMKRVLSANQV